MVDNSGIQFTIIERSPKVSDGWLETHLPKTVIERLQNYIETAKKNPINWNKNLAGNISKSLVIEDKDKWFFETILFPLLGKFTECYPSYSREIQFLTKDVPYCLYDFCVNFQKRHFWSKTG